MGDVHRAAEAGLARTCVLVVGWGFGDDCFQLAGVGAKAYGFDLSPEVYTHSFVDRVR